jgi:nicotinamidase-related amidase
MLADELIFFTLTGSKQEVIQEQASSMVVNAHGGLAMLRTKVVPGQILTVVNKRDSRKAQSRVVWTRESHEEQSLVAFEFTEPTPTIWPVILPPGDWNQWGDRSAREAGDREDSPV